MARASTEARSPISEKAAAYRARFHPDATDADWNDWSWQMRHRLRKLEDLHRVFKLSEDEAAAVAKHAGVMALSITPYYASLMSADDPDEPLRRTHIPVLAESMRSYGESDDPLGEDHDMAAPGLVHRYPDRVLFLVTRFCATYCRYCTRSRIVGETDLDYAFSTLQWEGALQYIAAHPEVRDVLLSGGDALTLSDDKLDHLLGRLRAIPHVEFVRIGTKVPIVLPMRVTEGLLAVLRKHKPVWMSLHVTHPDELTPEAVEACSRLADAGVPLGSQTVLMKGINDDVDTQRRLMHGLLKARVKPYYLFACDPISGSAHFRSTVEKGLEIVGALRGHTTGYAAPTFAVDAPGGGGKVALLPDNLVGRDGKDILLRSYDGKVYRYPDPDGTLGRRS
jgi:lysine 2,3-aminomutase